MARRIQRAGPYSLEPKLRRESDAIWERKPPSYGYPDGYGVTDAEKRVVAAVVKGPRMAWLVRRVERASDSLLGGGRLRIKGYVLAPEALASGASAKQAVEAWAVKQGRTAAPGAPPVNVVQTRSFSTGTVVHFRGQGGRAHWDARDKLLELVRESQAVEGGSIEWKQLEAGKPTKVVAAYEPEQVFKPDGRYWLVWKATTRKLAGLPFRGPNPPSSRRRPKKTTAKPKPKPVDASAFAAVSPKRGALGTTAIGTVVPGPQLRSGPLDPRRRKVFQRSYGLTDSEGLKATPAIVEEIYAWRTARGLSARSPKTKAHLIGLLGFGRPAAVAAPVAKRTPKAAAKKAPPDKPIALPKKKATDPLLKIRLRPASAKQQAQRLAKSRAAALRKKDREKLRALRSEIAEAKKRQRAAMRRAVELCRRGRLGVRARVKDYRERERERINREVSRMREEARTQCALRKARIRAAASSVGDRKRRALAEERKLQAQLRRYEQTRKQKHAALRTGREARAESDDAVRSNLPPELVPVFDKVRASVKAGPRRSRTEAFLEWAAENPAEVIALQQHDADREVKRLVREREALETRLAKTKPYEATSAELRKLEAMGLSRSQTQAEKHARDLRWGAEAPF